MKTDLLQKWASLKAKGISKEAGFFRDIATYGVEYAHANRYPLTGAAIGGALGAAEGFIISKRWKGKPSWIERNATKMTDQVAFEEMVRAKRGETPNAAARVKKLYADTYAGMAKIWSEHPIAAATFTGATGASIGANTARFVELLKRTELE